MPSVRPPPPHPLCHANEEARSHQQPRRTAQYRSLFTVDSRPSLRLLPRHRRRPFSLNSRTSIRRRHRTRAGCEDFSRPLSGHNEEEDEEDERSRARRRRRRRQAAQPASPCTPFPPFPPSPFPSFFPSLRSPAQLRGGEGPGKCRRTGDWVSRRSSRSRFPRSLFFLSSAPSHLPRLTTHVRYRRLPPSFSCLDNMRFSTVVLALAASFSVVRGSP
jgi:hypothetical protein